MIKKLIKKFLKKYYKYIKRSFDFMASLIALIILAIPMLIISLLIWLEDHGSPFYISERIGKKEKPFRMYKFRSMKENRKELDGTLTHDQMVTKIGKFIRKTSIDELPQLINVLKGDMALIGPRPWIKKYYDNMTPIQKRRSNVRPGIIGLAQVRGRNGIPINRKIEYDLEYVNHYGLKYDLKIIKESIKVVLSKENAEITEAGIKEEINDLMNNPKLARKRNNKAKA